MDYESEGSLGYKRRPQFKALVWGDSSASKEFSVQTCLPESMSTVHKESRHSDVRPASHCGGRQEDGCWGLAGQSSQISESQGQ